MIELLLYLGPLISSGIQLFKNNIADNYIKRNGYKILDDNRTKEEKISSFINNYFYILIPFYNYYKAFKLFTLDDMQYINKRKNMLIIHERLKEVKKEEVIDIKKEVKKQDKNSESNVIDKQSKKKSISNDIDELINEISQSDDIRFLYKIKVEYRTKSNNLRKEYSIKKSNCASNSELNNIVRKVKIYDRVFTEARDRLNYIMSLEINKKYSL